ncbi:MAG: 2-oxoglutarate/2-oxoacid ferredoxin oxidoreductase subunit alpha [Azoarcus sp.]|uniref:2-oxoglutarate ferredoxin oxidoreductase subunit alpha n=1 Tax=Aromatoleum tolulyticum TaxID=34027 RepID=A0A1N7AED3_9RHOO|nr:2-oxoacid:acceptor oxidoreductase subunit alpha [Aromatoleum tolulyticum]MCK9987586.1 2-oxoglutarate/2-oxoacid ferredoxin oxidoreductase subunit alpha [Azoarcus sp.]SIR37530.1 2-oxoglutarate ferredoxin oxidoreductase subunit alpha [Aromatoleum tolulyticum]
MGGQTVSLVMAGSGGAGVVTAGSLLLEAAARAGWYAYMTRSSGPQIRGGEAAVMIRLGTEPLASHDDRFHLLVGVDWQNVGRFAAEIPLGPESLIIGDPGEGETPEVFTRSGAQQIALPMKALAKTVPDGRPNMVAFGAIAGMIGLTEDVVVGVLRDTLKRKGEAAIAASLAAFRAGVEAAADFPAVPRLPATQADTSERWSITGNEATGMGALRGGVRFVAAYPITPATEVLEWLAPALPKVGGVLVQAEDELASINQIIGGSYGGVPSLTATSGPGLALMTESLGLAVAAEVPIVVIDVMRVGPSTGIATKSEQADLNIAVYGLHGDAPHLVLAPTSVADCLFTTQWAVHLAESLQTAAIVLTDQAMGQARAVMPRSAAVSFIGQREKPAALAEGVQYKRYANTASGVSPMAIPGMAGYTYTADGLEHNETGTPSSQASDHQAQLDKRLRKLTGYNYGDHWADITGDEDADTAILTWGSSAGPAREALERLRAAGHAVKLVAVRLISPVQPEKFAEALKGVERVLVVEQSHSGQFHRYLRAQYDLPRQVKALHHPGPLAVRPGAIVEHITQWS